MRLLLRGLFGVSLSFPSSPPVSSDAVATRVLLWLLRPDGSGAVASEKERRLMNFEMTAAVGFLGGTKLEKDRAVLAVFPLFMLFFLLAWMILVGA